MYVALHGMYSDGNFAFRRKMKKTLIRNSASLSQLKEMQKKKKKRGKENRKKSVKKKGAKLLRDVSVLLTKVNEKLTVKLDSSKCHTTQHRIKK